MLTEIEQAYSKIVKDHLDHFGYIVQGIQDHGPLGDSAQRLGMYYIPAIVLGLEHGINVVELVDKIDWPDSPRRHPNWDSAEDFSRDQAIGVICLLLMSGNMEAEHSIRKFYSNILDNNGFFPNAETLPDWFGKTEDKIPDFLTPGFVALCRRADPIVNTTWLNFLDSTETLFALYRKHFCKTDKRGFTDDVNLTLQAYTCAKVKPTFFSKLTWKIVRSFAGPRLDYYFREESYAPPLNVLWKELIKQG